MSSSTGSTGTKLDTKTDMTAAMQAGNNLNAAQDVFVQALSITDNSDTKTLAKLAAQFGVKGEEKTDEKGVTKTTFSLEAIQMAAKRALDRAESTYNMMSQLFSQKKRAIDSIIQNLRA